MLWSLQCAAQCSACEQGEGQRGRHKAVEDVDYSCAVRDKAKKNFSKEIEAGGLSKGFEILVCVLCLLVSKILLWLAWLCNPSSKPKSSGEIGKLDPFF